MDRFVYADNAATTKVTDHVLEVITPFLKTEYGNPSSIYSIGRNAKKAIEQARADVAASLNADTNEIYFTGSGTESDNWAIKGVMELMVKKGKNHLITTNFEHHAVLHVCNRLEKQGITVTYLPVDSEGYISPKQVKEAITDKTGLVTIMYANNEVGTIQPIAEIGAICREAGVVFHTDAVQAVGNVDIDVKKQCIDLLSLSGHKLGATKGVGALYIKKGTPLLGYIDGGAQEKNRRAGTENTVGIIALATAVKDATTNVNEKVSYVSELRDYMVKGILSSIPKCRVNGGDHRLCGNANISFEAVEGEALLLMLDMNGIAASSGSACTSGSLDPSHVLLALGLPHEVAHGSLRLTINHDTTKEDVDYILEVLPKVVARIRSMSPLWNE